MILGYAEIVEMVDKHNLLENVEWDNIGGAGVDLRLKTVYKPKTLAVFGKAELKLPKVEEIGGDKVILEPGRYVLAETVEKVNMPDDLVARVLPRSSLFRCGGSLKHAVIDPGYKGTLTFGLKNEGEFNLMLEKGARICQIVFERVSGGTKSYSGRYQGGKVV